MKKTVVVGAVAILGAMYLGAPADIAETRANEQAAFLRDAGKYQHIPKRLCGENIECQVDEMLHPDGVRGFVITEWRTNNDGTVDRRITSHDREYQTTDWVQIVGLPTSATST